MMSSPERAIALDLPLTGSQLIEASAGTGKTFTIALLYVRLVLGHGQSDSDASPHGDGFSRPLVPPEILVVTFTEAASLELRDRIRERLVQATEAFRAEDGNDGLVDRDPLLAGLRADYAREAWPRCARSLQLAAEWMDDAAISTIHSWTQRMLKEHAFDSGKLFRQEIVTDLNGPTLEAVTDYWRSRVYPLSEPLAAVMVGLFGSPQGLHSQLRRLLQREEATLVSAGEPLAAGDLDSLLARAALSREALRVAEADARDAYRQAADEIHRTLHDLRGVMNGTTFRGVNRDETFAGWLAELSEWGAGQHALEESPFVQKLARERFRLKKGGVLPALALFDALQTWHEQQAAGELAQRELQPAVLAEARDWVGQRLAAQLEARAQMGFDGMIRGLAGALDSDAGEALARRIRTQFPVAMIDEFQDTDPAQYRIFQRIYGIGSAAPDAALILIGDPKQAIYGFRGGDIHTYLAAREATRGCHHTLGRNFRSSAGAVRAVNQLFLQAESAYPRAAFRFAEPDNPDGNPLPFHPVDANGRDEQLLLDGEPAPAMTGWLLAGDGDLACFNKQAYLREAARHCANRIAGWLNQAQARRSGFLARDGDGVTPLKAGDIAVLVRDRKEAKAIREALAARGLASVYLSDRDSVFATPEARDLHHWLRAMASPEDPALLRVALATATLGRSLGWLDALQRDEMAFEDTQARFIHYRQLWQRRGVLPALRRLLHDFHVPESLLGREQGERALTNLLHLAEWAQQSSDSLDGDHALIRLLAGHIAEPGADEQVLRLESDAELIQVVTIFKSKGLEYPVVALPFLCTYREVDARYGSPLYHVDHRPFLELAAKKELAPEGFQRADDERLSEEVRLLYVALTRARHATFIGLAPLAVGPSRTATLHKSALGYLLAGGEKIPDLQSLRACWLAQAEHCADIHLEEGGSTDTVHETGAAPPVGKAARLPGHTSFKPWWIASYSALRYLGLERAPETADAEVRDDERETPLSPRGQDEPQTPAPGSLHAFPRGPEPGTFLHGVLEDLADRGFDRALEDGPLLAQIAERLRKRGWDAHAQALHHGMQAWLTTPLAPSGENGPTLAHLSRYRAEPDFWFATTDATTPAVDRLLQAQLFSGAPRPPLGEQRLNGLMKGFIDLLAEHEGRFYVIDWKSTWLGVDDSAYHAEAMQTALLDKRYDLQLAIYLIALHRHLRHSLGESYDYDRHVGGAMLVFLRGIDAPSRGVVTIKPSLAVIQALDDCLAGAGSCTAAGECTA
ncbi:exodeoxyribonuclease V subunit beta [Chromatocurvus halotolerans]|uniref:RecBCD enzyme subunit RecB n=1 Tax=Chromatocurvus halotolerans TaxID=1132028 RepID=A0A4R2L2D2_9GAMM|nr:exodeoxyribonuclease V subunit beta [Chromatocurvus halotolerans]TCO76718.1 DNA helicase/exodeoxyribonuclease V beta subunit [Chromatocurvus halotolerans]